MIELKPCPFCCGKAKLRISSNFGSDNNFFVSCMKCGCRTPIWNKNDVIERWNRRTNNEPTD